MAGRFTRAPILLGAVIGAGMLALAIPVLAQSGPESILPPGFSEQPPPKPPKPAPSPSPSGTPAPAPERAQPATAPNMATGTAAAVNPASTVPDNGPVPGEAEQAATGPSYDLPPRARRSLDTIGPLTPALGGLGQRAFGTGNGAAMARIMAATRAPFASRWASILLRRALLSYSDTPSDIGGADWVAERAWLLMRMGEADNARLLILGVDNDQYSKRLYAVAMQTLLATADPAGFCPLLPRALDFSSAPSWFMAQAICASFSGDQNSATAVLNQAERRGIAHGIDYRLAEKTVGSGPNSRRSVKIEWDGVPRLTAWRFGLATATNVKIPAALYTGVGPQVRAWEARAPMRSLAQRLTGTVTATRLGVFSGTAARGFFDQLSEQPDATSNALDLGEMLRTAYAGETTDERVAAMRSFWTASDLTAAGETAPGPGGVHYGALPVLARAAASVEPDRSVGEATPWLIAAMLSGGYDRNAARWSNVVEKLEGAAGERAWALLATGSPTPQVKLSAKRIEDFVSQDESDNRLLGHVLIAALGGLGRLPADTRADLLKGMGIDPVAHSRWARALMAAAGRGEKGTVALLVAVGLQTGNWKDVPPLNLYFITAALHRVGLDPYARMIAAEALART